MQLLDLGVVYVLKQLILIVVPCSKGERGLQKVTQARKRRYYYSTAFSASVSKYSSLIC
jgi:hypothetical protein